MIELKNIKQLENAISRAKSESKNLVVKMTSVSRQYYVQNRKNGKLYEINFKVNALGKRFGHCTCPAGELGKLCKHIAAAAGLNTCLAEQGFFKAETQITR